MPPKLEVRAISKVYATARARERVEALRDVSFSVNTHELIAIVGPSGCGKSTLLSIIAGLESPTTGEVVMDGRPVTKPGPERGVVFQEYALFPWRTVLGNVEFGPMARGITKLERRRTALRLIDLVGLKGFEHRYPHELSGGMRQRCALARLLANEPEIWLMDEPLAAVDLQTRNILQEELLRLWGDQKPLEVRKTVLYVTHGIEEAVFLADRVLVLGRRPGAVKEVVPIELPRPRAGLRTSPKAVEYVTHIWELVRRGAERAMVEEAS